MQLSKKTFQGDLITVLTAAVLRLWSKHLLFHLISNKWEAWAGGKREQHPGEVFAVM